MPWPVRTVLMVALIALPLYGYFWVRLASAISTVVPVPRSRARWIVLVVLCLLYALPVTFLLYYYNGWTRDLFIFQTQLSVLDYIMHFPFWWGLIIVLESVPFFLVLDMSSPFTRLWPTFRPRWLRWQAYAKVAFVSGAVLYIPIRSYADTYQVRDTRTQISIETLPEELEGLRISLVADLQIDRSTGLQKVRQVNEILRTTEPDILFFAGDLVTSGKAFIPLASEAICPPEGRLANIAVMGDHDYWADKDTIPEIMRNCGWSFLENQHSLLSVRGQTILVTGITHVYSSRIGAPALHALLQLAPRADLKILIVHQPAESLVHIAAQHGYDLILAGHTHGGQIVFHPFGIPFTPSRLETDYYSGVYQAGAAHVVVTNGIGLTLAPVRYHAPSEVTTLQLSHAGGP